MTSEEAYKAIVDDHPAVEEAVRRARIAALKEAIPFCCGSCAAGSVPFLGRVNDKFTMFPEKMVHAAKENPEVKWSCMAGDLLQRIGELEATKWL